MDYASKYVNGPYVQVAGFCDMVLEDKSGVLSLIRMVDTCVTVIQGTEVPKEMPPIQHPMFLVVMLKSGAALGRNEIQIIPEYPNGSSGNPITYPIEFQGEERGANIIVNFATFTFQFEGLYLFRVKLDGGELTAVPFKVKYSPHRISTGN